jgi:hypothetical protein
MIGCGMALQEFLSHFVRAAMVADQRYQRTRELAEIRLGIEVWETLQTAPGLADAPRDARIDASLAASMLYARRHEAEGALGDLGLALQHLEEARRLVIPGSFADLQVRMSTAAWLMARYQAGGPPADLDQAIAAWAELVQAGAGALAAANLGRALLARHQRSGDPADLRSGRDLLARASAELPSDHPVRADVELALRSAQ